MNDATWHRYEIRRNIQVFPLHSIWGLDLFEYVSPWKGPSTDSGKLEAALNLHIGGQRPWLPIRILNLFTNDFYVSYFLLTTS